MIAACGNHNLAQIEMAAEIARQNSDCAEEKGTFVNSSLIGKNPYSYGNRAPYESLLYDLSSACWCLADFGYEVKKIIDFAIFNLCLVKN